MGRNKLSTRTLSWLESKCLSLYLSRTFVFSRARRITQAPKRGGGVENYLCWPIIRIFMTHGTSACTKGTQPFVFPKFVIVSKSIFSGTLKYAEHKLIPVYICVPSVSDTSKALGCTFESTHAHKVLKVRLATPADDKTRAPLESLLRNVHTEVFASLLPVHH